MDIEQGKSWGRPWSRDQWRWLTAALGASWVLIAAISLFNVNGLYQRLDQIARTQELIGLLASVQSRATDVETAQRGYILTGTEDHLQPYVGAGRHLDAILERIEALTETNPTQARHLRTLRTLMERRVAHSERVIDAYRRAGLETVRRTALISQGKAIHDAIRQQVATMTRIEQALLEERQSRVDSTRRMLNWSIGIALALLALGILLSWRLGSARARAEARLKRTESRYRELFEASPFPMCIVNFATGRIDLANEATVALYGYPRDQLATMTIEQFFGADQIEELREARETIMTGEPYPLRLWRQLRADGKAIDVELITRAIPSLAMGNAVRLVVIIDATERERLMGEVRRSEALFQEIFDLQFQLLATFDTGGRIETANRLFVSTLGIDRDELIGQRFDTLPFEDAGDAPLAFTQLTGNLLQSTAQTRFRLRLADPRSGEPRLFEATVRPAVHEGRVSYFIFQARDVTESVKVMERLTSSERRLLAAQDRAGMCIWEWDIDEHSMWWSRNCHRVLGGEPDDVPAGLTGLLQIAAPAEIERLRAFLDNIHHVIGSSYIRFRGARANGPAERHFELVAEHVPGTGSAQGQLVGSICDISDDIALEARMQQSQRLEAVGKLTGGVAHDFNNLLTVIIGNSEVLVDELQTDGDLRELAELSLAAASRGAELTSQLLAFARRQPLEPQLVAPVQLLRDMQALLRKTLTPQIELEFVSDAGAWSAMVDPTQLESAILNLAINARDAMPSGGRLTIEIANARLDAAYAAAHSDVSQGYYVMIAVSDTGTGMPPAIRERVFEPFFTTKPGGDNSGLGLSMVHGFIKQTGGHIKIYSEVDSGTTVRIYLPRHVGSDVGISPKPYLDDEVRGGSERILLVEDDEMVRNHVAKQLTGLGYRVVIAGNGNEALRIFSEDQAFDLLFTDVVMPGGINGRQLAHEVHAIAPRLPVLFSSGYTENAIVHHGRLDAGVFLLSKPYRLATLASKLRQALDRERA